jgi:hypothetical protein
MVPRVAMLTTAGDAFLIMGASEGSPVSPAPGGMPARAAVAVSTAIRQDAESEALMAC